MDFKRCKYYNVLIISMSSSKTKDARAFLTIILLPNENNSVAPIEQKAITPVIESVELF